MTETIHDVLAPVLAEQGVSGERLAALVGCDRSMVSRTLTGSRHPSRELVTAIADALALRPLTRRRLFIAAGYHDPLPPAVEAVTARLLVLDAADRALVGAMVERIGGRA